MQRCAHNGRSLSIHLGDATSRVDSALERGAARLSSLAGLPSYPVLRGCPAIQSCRAAPQATPSKAKRGAAPFSNLAGLRRKCATFTCDVKLSIAPHAANEFACTRPPCRVFASSRSHSHQDFGGCSVAPCVRKKFFECSHTSLVWTFQNLSHQEIIRKRQELVALA